MFKLIFLSSNKTKLAHANYLLNGYDIELVPPPDYGRPYIEPRISDRDTLLEESLNNANQRLARNLFPTKPEDALATIQIDLHSTNDIHAKAFNHQHKIFFIEDTSIAIDELSKEGEFPGVDVKFWMRENDFSSVDTLLKKHGNNRRVSVRSDVVLYLPPALRQSSTETYKVFTGITHGQITETEKDFDINPLHPWLDNKTFNKWFIPEGETEVISLLPIEKTLEHDFRKKALDGMLLFLEEKGLIKKKTQPLQPQFQIELFQSVDFIFCGPTCSGKTVLASFISKKFGYQHIEASDFMKKLFHERHGLNSGLDIHTFAKETLDFDVGMIANEIADYILLTKPYRFVVTGFRNAQEIRTLKKRLNREDIEPIYIDSPIKVRFKRNRTRGRSDKLDTFVTFKERNKKQESMGLPQIKKISTSLKNNESLFSYIKSSTDKLIPSNSKISKFNCSKDFRPIYLQLEQIILIALLYEEKNNNTPLTTSEIAKTITKNLLNFRTKDDGSKVDVNKNNVSRHFNQKFNIHFEIVKRDKIIKYKLSQTGKSAAIAIIRNLT